MRRFIWIIAIVLSCALMISGCGKKKDAKDVVKDLEQVLERMDSYEASGSILLQTSAEPVKYEVEIWHLQPHYYRIALTNEKNDVTQIILKNDEGVFILTPQLNKSIRFQSGWPDHRGQVYLYETLVKSILQDHGRLFAIDEVSSSYVFDVIANYDDHSLARQKIWLNNKTFAPEHVEIVDAQKNVVVVVEFDHFVFGKKFDEDSFDKQRNLTTWDISSWPALASYDHEGDGEAGAMDTMVFPGVIHPAYTPEGVVHIATKELTLGEHDAVMLSYEGDYQYSILQMKPQVQDVSILPGDIVDIIDMHFTVGMMTGTDYKMLRWIHDGVEYRLSSGDLPQSEMIRIAKSVQGQSGK